MMIRHAQASDAAAIARVHVQSWHETYTGIIPDDYLARQSVERRQQMWESIFARADGTIVLVAETPDGEIVGFASAGRSRGDFADYDSEVYAVYLLQKSQKTGTGYALFQQTLTALNNTGYSAMYLWVLQDNTPACQFYERTGGVQITTRTEAFNNRELVEIAYGWNPIHTALVSKKG